LPPASGYRNIGYIALITALSSPIIPLSGFKIRMAAFSRMYTQSIFLFFLRWFDL
jgi:hypothetical protein